MSLLELDQVDGGYGDVQILRGISLRVEEGSVTALVGANGAGKTTTLLTIAGVLRPWRGAIRYRGERIDGLSPDEIVRRGISLVPEGRQLFTQLTVRENLEMGAFTPELRRRRKESLEQVYALFPRLLERERQLAGTLSGGEQQMLAIGRALMAQPSLLMLDEPSIGLAPILVRQIFETIERISRTGTTVLLVEQNVGRCLQLSHYGYVIERGQIVLEGRGEELLANPRTRQAYIGVA